MAEQRIKCGSVELSVITKRIQAINAAQAELQRASELGNETFSLFCAARNLDPNTQFVKIEGEEIVVALPAPQQETPADTPA